MTIQDLANSIIAYLNERYYCEVYIKYGIGFETQGAINCLFKHASWRN